MKLRYFMQAGATVGAAGTILLAVAAAQAAMQPATDVSAPYTQNVDCALGAHIGPVGGCILGTDNPPAVVVVAPPAAESPQPVVIEPNRGDLAAPADGCATKSVTITDGSGNSETRTKTKC